MTPEPYGEPLELLVGDDGAFAATSVATGDYSLQFAAQAVRVTRSDSICQWARTTSSAILSLVKGTRSSVEWSVRVLKASSALDHLAATVMGYRRAAFELTLTVSLRFPGLLQVNTNSGASRGLSPQWNAMSPRH